MRRTFALAALLTLAACGGSADQDAPDAAEPTGSLAPGGTVDLNEVFKSALIGAPADGPITWAIIGTPPPQAAYSAGLSLSSAGLLRLPSCEYVTTYAYRFPLTFSITATSGTTQLMGMAITVDERFLGSNVACYIVSGETTCRDPAGPLGIVLEVGKTLQYYSRQQTTCGSTWSPALPAGACPASDPAFAFCQ